MDRIRRVTVLLLSAPFTRRAVRDVWFCATEAITGLVGFALVVAIGIPGLVVSASVVGAVIGLPLLAAAIGLARLLGAWHRRALLLATGERVTAPRPSTPPSGAGRVGPLARLNRALGRPLRDPGGWRAVGYAAAKLPVAVAGGYVAAATLIGLADCAYPLAWVLFGNRPVGERDKPLKALAPVYHGQHWVIHSWAGTLVVALVGVGSVLAGVWLARGIVTLDAALMRSLLGPSRVSELERTRAIAVEDTAAALRRVERDLHDGAQVRLAAVAMNLGLAREKAADEALRELLDAAQAGVSGALADLRRLARGIHPPVLDSGLADALTSLAVTSPIPARVRGDLPERPSPAIETMAYFCAAELLANAIKHSGANVIEIVIDPERAGLLRLRVTDDGLGGADPARGGGLEGLTQRVSTVDGVLRLSSPPGGPTTVTVELPMRIRGGNS
jgi:signal transduction histidine kinase